MFPFKESIAGYGYPLLLRHPRFLYKIPVRYSFQSPFSIKIHALEAHSDNKPFVIQELDEWTMWAMMNSKKKGDSQNSNKQKAAFPVSVPPPPPKVASLASKPAASSKPVPNVAGEKNKKSAPIKIPSPSKTSKGSSSSSVKGNNVDWSLPPHEISKRKMALEGFKPSSVLVGAGRTLKGRDLFNVRNKVLGLTGYLTKAEAEKPMYSKK